MTLAAKIQICFKNYASFTLQDAYERNEFEWIRNTMKKLQRIMIVMYGMIVIMVIISPIIYRTWVGSSVFIPYSLSSLMAVYAIVFIWSTIYSNFLL